MSTVCRRWFVRLDGVHLVWTSGSRCLSVRVAYEDYSYILYLETPTEPNFDTLVECLPHCSSPSNPPKYPPTIAGQHILDQYASAHPGYTGAFTSKGKLMNWPACEVERRQTLDWLSKSKFDCTHKPLMTFERFQWPLCVTGHKAQRIPKSHYKLAPITSVRLGGLRKVNSQMACRANVCSRSCSVSNMCVSVSSSFLSSLVQYLSCVFVIFLQPAAELCFPTTHALLL